MQGSGQLELADSGLVAQDLGLHDYRLLRIRVVSGRFGSTTPLHNHSI